MYEYEQYHQGQDIGNIDSGPFWKFDSGACVGFFTEVFPSPSDAASAEQEDVYKRQVSRLEFLRSAAAFLKGHGCSPGGFRLSLHGAPPSVPRLKRVTNSRFSCDIFHAAFRIAAPASRIYFDTHHDKDRDILGVDSYPVQIHLSGAP